MAPPIMEATNGRFSFRSTPYRHGSVIPITAVKPEEEANCFRFLSFVFMATARVAPPCAMLDASIPGPFTISYPRVEIWLVAIGVIAQAVPVSVRNGWKAPISIGINQLTLSFKKFAPLCTRSFNRFPSGPTTISAIGIAINIIIIGFRKNLITDGEYFSANFST